MSESKHQYLIDYDQTLKDRVIQKRESKAQYDKVYRRTYVKGEGAVNKHRDYMREWYHKKKTLTHCDVCDKDVYYIKKHKLTDAHINRLNKPIDIVKDLFPAIIDPILAIQEETNRLNLDELSQLKKDNQMLADKLDEAIVKPLVIQTKKDKYGHSKRSFA